MTAARQLVMTDYDGTLADIVRDPAQAHPHPQALPVLHRLIDRGHEVYIVTGRRRADLLRLLKVDPGRVVGVHGLEWPEQEMNSTWKAQAQQLLAHLPGLPGVTLEDKGVAISVHYRGLPLQQGRELLERLQRVPLPTGWETLSGKKVVEFRPTGGGKGRAAQRLAARHPEHRPLFIGDDLTDEDAFHTVQAGGGVGVKVGAGPTSAQRRVSSVQGALRYLDEL